MDDNLSILIKAILDEQGIKQDIKDLDKIAEKYTLNFKASIDKGELTNSIKAVLPKIIADVNKAYNLKLPIDVDDKILDKSINQYQSAMKKMASEVNKIQLSLSDKSYEAEIAKITKGFIALSGDANEARTHVQLLQTAYEKMRDATDDNSRLQAEKEYQLALSKTKNELSIAQAEAKEYVDVLKVNKLRNDIQDWLKNNTAATKEAKDAMVSYLNMLDGDKISPIDFNTIKSGVDDWDTAMRQAGKLGKSLVDTFEQGAKSFIEWAVASGSVMDVVESVKTMISTVAELDTALVDLRKTTTMTAKELEDFYYQANETAKQMGVTTQSIIEQASAWSRLGYSSQEAATKMAKYSSMFATISPGMDLDSATDGLVSVMKAFKIGAEDVDDVVDGIMSKINIIGNTRALNNSDIVDFLTRSSSAMAEANNSLEDTIALGTAAVEITRDAASVGNALKTVSMRIRGYDEETEEFIGGVEELSGKIADLTKTASSPSGISLFSDDAKTEYKSTLELFNDISNIYHELNDKQQAGLLEALAGKRQGQIVAAILNNYEAVTSSLDSMANSAGNAEKEMAIAMDSIAYKANITKEIGSGIAQNLFGREDMKSVLDIINSLGEGLDWLTEKLGLFGSIGLGAGLFASFKNVGTVQLY